MLRNYLCKLWGQALIDKVPDPSYFETSTVGSRPSIQGREVPASHSVFISLLSHKETNQRNGSPAEGLLARSRLFLFNGTSLEFGLCRTLLIFVAVAVSCRSRGQDGVIPHKKQLGWVKTINCHSRPDRESILYFRIKIRCSLIKASPLTCQ